MIDKNLKYEIIEKIKKGDYSFETDEIISIDGEDIYLKIHIGQEEL